MELMPTWDQQFAFAFPNDRQGELPEDFAQFSRHSYRLVGFYHTALGFGTDARVCGLTWILDLDIAWPPSRRDPFG